MLTLQIHNLSSLDYVLGDDSVCSYRYTVFINRDMIATGTVKGHKRANGWPALVAQIAEEHIVVTPIRTPAKRRKR